MAHILVADDDPDIRQLVVMKLRAAGHRTTEVGDGPSALAAARADRPDLLLLDLMMPGMTGIEVCQVLREDDASLMPIILLTARAQERDVQAGLAAGATAYLSKPFSPRGLAELVALHLEPEAG